MPETCAICSLAEKLAHEYKAKWICLHDKYLPVGGKRIPCQRGKLPSLPKTCPKGEGK